MLKVGDIVEKIVLVDGGPPERALCVVAPVEGSAGCEKHCASHGGGPFACCRCGAAFVYADDERWSENWSYSMRLLFSSLFTGGPRRALNANERRAARQLEDRGILVQRIDGVYEVVS